VSRSDYPRHKAILKNLNRVPLTEPKLNIRKDHPVRDRMVKVLGWLMSRLGQKGTSAPKAATSVYPVEGTSPSCSRI
jgi:hypothetical protein